MTAACTRYDVGDDVRLSVTIRKATVLTDPGTLTLIVKRPDGTSNAYVYGEDSNVVRDSEGMFHADIPVDASGFWRYRWEGTPPAKYAEEGSFIVREQRVTA